eukprot:TRINITY_DN3213_c0_g1_i10.p1 TRINITY_DN3213_c0_g1~~TRINITY_DN3213_c0_g1_i10.p1  ORF type:complete len:135 (-),score=22.28 TRINITY_DN3213_c0_g1_i10:190-594(-)
MKMGHGDEIVIADGNFPATSHASNILVRCDGISATQILRNILKLLPLDTYEPCVIFMEPMHCDKNRYKHGIPPIWEEYLKITMEEESVLTYVAIERFAFYERAKKAFAIVATSETSQYANIILKKGCIKEPLAR